MEKRLKGESQLSRAPQVEELGLNTEELYQLQFVQPHLINTIRNPSRVTDRYFKGPGSFGRTGSI